MDDAAPNLGDYFSILRQQARTILAAALIGVVLSLGLWALQSGGDSWVRRSRVAIQDDSQFLALVLPGPLPESRVSIPQVVSEINSPAFRAAVLKQAGLRPRSATHIQATGDEPTRLVTIEVNSASAATTNSVLDLALKQLRARRRQQLISGYESVTVALTARRDLAGQRIAAIDGIIAAEPPGSPRAATLVHERVLVQEDLDESAAALSAISGYGSDGDGGVRIVGGSTRAGVASGLPLPVAVVTGFLLGLVGGTGLVILRRFLRPVVDSRAGLERCGTGCVAVLGRTAGDRVAQAAVARLTADGPLAVLRAPGVPPSVLDRLLPELESSSVKVCDELPDVASGARLLLIVASGGSEDEVRSLVMTARSIGAEVVGTVLTGVPDGGLVQALSR